MGYTSVSLSADSISAIKESCFGNISGFYRRYEKDLKVSRATFFRMLRGESTRSFNVYNVQEALQKIGLSATLKEGWTERQLAIRELVKRIDKLIENPIMDNVAYVMAYFKENRIRILGPSREVMI